MDEMMLPTMDNVVFNDENVYNKIYKKVISKLVFESIGEYYSKEYIDSKLDNIIRIEEENEECFIWDTDFDKRILRLPRCFFSVKINNSNDVLNLLEEYHVLKDLLTIYGIYVISANRLDSREDKIIKNMVSAYFAIKSNGSSLTEIETADMSFKGYVSGDATQENIIRELEIVFGEKLLLETLTKGISYFECKIDEKTKKKGLGKKISDGLVQLHEMSVKEKKYVSDCKILDTIKNDKMIPMYKFIKKYDPVYQDAIFNLIEMKDFDFSVLSLFFDNIDESKVKALTEEEKNKLRECIKLFNENWESYYYLETRYPKVKFTLDYEGDKVYDKDSFTLLNKFLTVRYEYNQEYFNLCSSIQNLWKNLNEIIVWEIIPRYIKNRECVTIDLDEILMLSKFTNRYIDYDISKKVKTKRLEKKIRKINK